MNEKGGSFIDKVIAAVGRENLIERGDSIIVALSGGADSMALLNSLLQIKNELGIDRLYAAHINHGIRGSESDRDEAFVKQQCSNLGVGLFIYRADVIGQAEKTGEGLEQAGRRIRYAFLTEKARETGASIATAHTLSDSIETVLLHQTRGCGLRGLAGIPALRPEGDIKLIRPLIDCTRAEVEDYCSKNSISYVTDSTNSDTGFARNRIRSCVIPHLREINPEVESAFLRLMRHAREDEDFLSKNAEDELRKSAIDDGYGGYSSEYLLSLPKPIRTRAITAAVMLEDPDAARRLTERHIALLEEMLEKGGGVTLSPRLEARVSQGRFSVFGKISEKKGGNLHRIKGDNEIIPLKSGVSCIFFGRIYRPSLMSLAEFEKRKKIHKNLLKNSLNYDKISGNLFLRSRQPGDAFRPAGRGVNKALKKLLGEEKVPAALRDAIPVVCDDMGIVLIGGIGCDERVKIDQSCRRVLVLDIVE